MYQISTELLIYLRNQQISLLDHQLNRELNYFKYIAKISTYTRKSAAMRDRIAREEACAQGTVRHCLDSMYCRGF